MTKLHAIFSLQCVPESLRSQRRCFFLGIAGLGLCAAWLMLLELPWQSDVASRLDAKLVALQKQYQESTAAHAGFDERQAAGAGAAISAPIATIARDLQTFSAAAGLALSTTAFRPASSASGVLRRMEIRAEFKGSYWSFKAAAAEILARHPNVALASFSMRRAASTDAVLDINAAFTAYEQ